MRMNNRSKMSVSLVTILGLSLGVGGCANSSTSTNAKTVQGQASLAPSKVQANFTIAVYAADKSGSPIQPALYTDTNKSSAFQLIAGKSYVLAISSNVATQTFKMVYTNIDLPTAPASSPVTLKVGNNLVVAPLAADYSFAITPVASASVQSFAKIYQASVACENPTFSTADLIAGNISATGGNNLFNFNSSTVLKTGNQNHGQAPFLCAWDFNGTGIVESAFADCGTPVQGVYVDYIGSRNVGLIVKDSCNVPVTVTKSLNLATATPSMPGNTFIQVTTDGNGAVGGTIANSSDPRIYGVQFVSTNPGVSPVPVQPSFNVDTSSNHHSIANFNIQSVWTYGMATSRAFGVGLAITGITGDYTNNGSGDGTLSLSQAQVKISYTTDQRDESAPAVQLGGNCTLSNGGIKSLFTTGTPCSGSAPNGDRNSLRVEVWGNITCNGISVPGGNNINISGSFDGMQTISNSCYGGGGGGGGVNPIAL